MAEKRVGRGIFFCWNCGAKVDKDSDNCPHCGAQYMGETRYGDTPVLGAGGVGWSLKANDPFFNKYAKKYIGISIVWMLALSILIPAVLLISGQVEPEGEGLVVLIVVPAVIWAFGLIFLVKKYTGRNKGWDGVVEYKTQEQKTRSEKTNKGTRTVSYTEYAIVFRRENGSTKRLTSENDSTNYDYFEIGDHVRLHDKNTLKYLEKYDKTCDVELFCAACGSLNDVRDNYCERCGAPMLKGNPDIPSTRIAPAPVGNDAVYCENCGAKLTGGEYCESCGAKVQ